VISEPDRSAASTTTTPSVAGADHGDGRSVGKIEPAFGIEERRRRIDMGERGRIALLTHDHETGPGAVGSFQLGLGLSLGETRIEARPPRRDRAGRASSAASAPPN
jgi:hypothetical protein